MSDKKLSVNLNLILTKEQLLQFYWNLYGSSLVKMKNTPEAIEGYSQSVNQIESFLISEDPDNLFDMEIVKARIREAIELKNSLS